MNDFNLFFKRLWDWIEHIVSMLASIMGILCFFGIDFSKIKPYILLITSTLKKYIYNAKKYITYRYREVQMILFKQYLNTIKILNRIINYLEKSLFSLSSCCLLLIIIFFYNPIDYLNGIRNELLINSENSDINMDNQSIVALYDMNTVQSSLEGTDVLVKAETSFPADNVTISAKSDNSEQTDGDIFDMHGGTSEWYFKANFYIKGTYTVTVTAYNSEGESVSDEFIYVY